jgi:acyl carrier protein
MAVKADRIERIRSLVARVLEIDPSDMTDSSRFKEDHGADSLRAIEILAGLEQEFDVVIAQEDLAKMVNLAGVYDVVRSHADWDD